MGLGAAYPDLQSENPAQAVTRFRGLLFMLLAAGFIAAVVVLECGPVYQIFMADFHGRSLSGPQWAWLIVSFALVLLLRILAVLLPMRLANAVSGLVLYLLISRLFSQARRCSADVPRDLFLGSGFRRNGGENERLSVY